MPKSRLAACLVEEVQLEQVEVAPPFLARNPGLGRARLLNQIPLPVADFLEGRMLKVVLEDREVYLGKLQSSNPLYLEVRWVSNDPDLLHNRRLTPEQVLARMLLQGNNRVLFRCLMQQVHKRSSRQLVADYLEVQVTFYHHKSKEVVSLEEEQLRLQLLEVGYLGHRLPPTLELASLVDKLRPNHRRNLETRHLVCLDNSPHNQALSALFQLEASSSHKANNTRNLTSSVTKK